MIQNNKESKEQRAIKKKRIILTMVSSILVICMCIGFLASYAELGIFDSFRGRKDDVIYYENGNLMQNGNVLFSDVKLEDGKLIMSNGYVLMENVTINDDGTIEGYIKKTESN